MLSRNMPTHPGGPRFEILPAIDLRAGRVVRLSEGDFARETVYGTDPAQVAKGFIAAGARWIHVVDLDGARAGGRRQGQAVAAILAVAEAAGGVGCQVAGGLRDEEAVASVLEAGAARAVVGTAALRDPSLVERLVRRFGAQRVAVALDVREGLAVGQGWVPGAEGIAVERAMRELAHRGARIFVVTAIERDGLLTGPNLALLGRLVGMGCGEILASAGMSSLADLAAVRELGCSGAIVGRALYEGRIDLGEAVREIRC